MKKYISLVLSGAIVLTLVFGSIAQAAALTQVQVNAIIGLLQSFGASASVVANVQSALTGQPTTGTTATTNNCSTITTGLTIGSTGQAVTSLQQTLINAGDLNISAPTGYFGNATFSAFKAWQIANNCTGTTNPAPITTPIVTSNPISVTGNQSQTINVITPTNGSVLQGGQSYPIVWTETPANQSTTYVLVDNAIQQTIATVNRAQAGCANSDKCMYNWTPMTAVSNDTITVGDHAISGQSGSFSVSKILNPNPTPTITSVSPSRMPHLPVFLQLYMERIYRV